MRRLLLLFIGYLFSTQIILSQSVIRYSSETKYLEMDTLIHRYRIGGHPVDELIGQTDLSVGKININNDIITCVDVAYKDTMRFVQIDKYRLRVVSENRHFKRYEIISASIISDRKGNALQWMYWKNGEKDGLWQFCSDCGVKFIRYEKGVEIEVYFKTWEEVRRDAAKHTPGL